MLLSLFSWSQEVGNLTVQLHGVSNSKGMIQIGLYINAKSFPKVDKQYLVAEIKAHSPNTNYTFENLPFGDYAIAVFHDENEDEKCNTNLFGIPSEGYGFSNNIKPFLSTPSFEKTKFKFNNTSNIKITLLY